MRPMLKFYLTFQNVISLLPVISLLRIRKTTTTCSWTCECLADFVQCKVVFHALLPLPVSKATETQLKHKSVVRPSNPPTHSPATAAPHLISFILYRQHIHYVLTVRLSGCELRANYNEFVQPRRGSRAKTSSRTQNLSPKLYTCAHIRTFWPRNTLITIMIIFRGYWTNIRNK